MPIDPEMIEKIKTWVNSKAPNLRCPVCGTSNWNVPELVAAPIFQNGGIYFGSVVPLIPLVCTNCSHTLLFAAAMMGLLPPAPE
jgi:hypothetical protein